MTKEHEKHYAHLPTSSTLWEWENLSDCRKMLLQLGPLSRVVMPLPLFHPLFLLTLSLCKACFAFQSSGILLFSFLGPACQTRNTKKQRRLVKFGALDWNFWTSKISLAGWQLQFQVNCLVSTFHLLPLCPMDPTMGKNYDSQSIYVFKFKDKHHCIIY